MGERREEKRAPTWLPIPSARSRAGSGVVKKNQWKRVGQGVGYVAVRGRERPLGFMDTDSAQVLSAQFTKKQ